MQIVLLAAGQGTRLQSLGNPKPLTPVLGVPLLERNLRHAISLSPSEIFIVTGYQHQTIKQWLEQWLTGWNSTTKISQPLPTIRCIYNDQWAHYDNGHSLRAAAPSIHKPFLLLMADHLYDRELLHALCQQPLDNGQAWLATDKRINRKEIDINDATKVKINAAGTVTALGKSLDHYNGIDCGAFYCHPDIAKNCLELAPEQSNRLSQIMMSQPEKHALKAFLHEYYWQDIDTPKDCRNAQKVLLKQASQKDNDGPISRWLNRPLSQLLTRLFIHLRWSPNQISLLAFFLALIAAVCIGQPEYYWLALGGILNQLASVIDGCDGEVARIQDKGTEYGGWLDALLDRYADIALLAALSWHAMQIHGYEWMWLGIAAVAGSFISSYSAHKADRMPGFKPLRIGRDLRCLIICLAAITAQPLWGLWVISIMMNLTVVYRIYLLYPGRQQRITTSPFSH